MNRRQFLTLVASVGVSAALPAKALPEIDPPYVAQLEDIPLNLSPCGITYVSEHYNDTHIRFSLPRASWRTLNAGQPLDSRREPWQDANAGAVPVQE